MNFSYLCIISSILFLLCPKTIQAVEPDSIVQQKMLHEEQEFLAHSQPGLQHKQMLAVRSAMQGNYSELQKIRDSRNKAPQLPDDITTFFPTPDICIFKPKKDSPGLRPVLLYLHGGGWCFGSINSCARFCAAVALEGDCIVAALNYRLAPKHAFPAPLQDCTTAVNFLRHNAIQWGGDSTNISVGGDSAGGNLALATALSTKGISKVIPIYPVTKLFTEETDSWLKYATGYGNDAELLEAFNQAYAGQSERDTLVSVGLCSDYALKSLPPTLFISAGHDILLDQTVEMVNRMQKLNRHVKFLLFPTATHLFITVPGQPTAFNEAVKAVSRFLTSANDC